MSNEPNKETGLAYIDTVEKALAAQRILNITGIILPTSYHEYATRLRYYSLTPGPITVYLNTPGGSLTDALGLFDVMRDVSQSGSPLTIVATGECMSAGVTILQAGDKRLAYPHTQFMIHELSSMSAGKLSEHLDAQDFEKRLQTTCDQIISERSGMTIEKLRSLYSRRDLFLSPADAKKLHLIDGIVSL